MPYLQISINDGERIKQPTPCLKCGQQINPYYLSPVKLEDGRTFLANRCLSCGFFERGEGG